MSGSHEHSAASVPVVTYAHAQKLNRENSHSALKPSIKHCKLSRQQQETTAWKQIYNQRAGIEGTLSQGLHAFGLRRSRYLGLAKTRLQHILTSTAMNIVRMVSWLQGVPHAKTRVSRFAALAPVPDYV